MGEPPICSDFGSYAAQVELVPPAHMARGDGRGICVDACLALEVTRLWERGITTTGCCCGHGRLVGFIGVADDDIGQMKALGYVVLSNPHRPGSEDSFIPFTPCVGLGGFPPFARDQSAYPSKPTRLSGSLVTGDGG
jgi:hypothetical protein